MTSQIVVEGVDYDYIITRMKVTITDEEYQELMRVKRKYEFIRTRLKERLKDLIDDSKKLNKTAFKTNDGDIVQNLEWVKLRYEISNVLHFVPDDELKELLE